MPWLGARRRLLAEQIGEIWRAALAEHDSRSQPCPACRRAMVVVPAPLPTPRVRVEVCPSCQFFWFDPGELEALPPAPASATPKDE